MSTATKPEGLPSLQIKLLSPAGRAPTRGSEFAAGYDVYASKAATIPAHGKVLVDTDVAMAVPAGTYGRIAPRSGLGLPPLPSACRRMDGWMDGWVLIGTQHRRISSMWARA